MDYELNVCSICSSLSLSAIIQLDFFFFILNVIFSLFLLCVYRQIFI